MQFLTLYIEFLYNFIHENEYLLQLAKNIRN